MNTLGVVIPCHRQERFLPRTLAALRSLPEGWRVEGALVLATPQGVDSAPPALDPDWKWLAPNPGAAREPLTPGAARMAGLAACGGEWVLFVDADVEVDAAWLARALGETASANRSRLAGLWGPIEEWFVDDRGHESRGAPDLYRVGMRDRNVDYLATLALYRRSALLDAGGYDPRLRSEEDFELGLRLRARGSELRSLGCLAARHFSAPRPSLGELSRRWSSGLCFGQGQVLRLYLGKPGFGTLLRRQALYLATLALWAALPLAAWIAAVRSTPAPLLAWLAVAAAGIAAMAVRKRSARLAAHSVLAWTLNGLGLVVGWFRIDPRAPREAPC